MLNGPASILFHNCLLGYFKINQSSKYLWTKILCKALQKLQTVQDLISYLEEYVIELKKENVWKVNQQLKAVYKKHLLCKGEKLDKYY